MSDKLEPQLRQAIFEAYMEKAIEHFIEEGIRPEDVDMPRMIEELGKMVDLMVSVEKEDGSIHFFVPGQEGFAGEIEGGGS
jgi:hypothetical protein